MELVNIQKNVSWVTQALLWPRLQKARCKSALTRFLSTARAIQRWHSCSYRRMQSSFFLSNFLLVCGWSWSILQDEMTLATICDPGGWDGGLSTRVGFSNEKENSSQKQRSRFRERRMRPCAPLTISTVSARSNQVVDLPPSFLIGRKQEWITSWV